MTQYREETATPTVSIGLPVYNGERFIREALDALLSQTFTDFELVISDNASTDGTDAIVREYAARDGRIRYIRQPKNRGPLLNYNVVLDEAVGEYFMWTAVDDRFGTAATLAKLVEAIRPGFELAIPDINMVDETCGITDQGILSSTFSRLGRQSFTEVALEFASYQIYGLFAIASLRKYYYLLTDNSDLSCFNEGIFVHTVSEKMKCVFVDDALLIYRRHGGNLSFTVAAPALFKSYLVYTWRVFSFYTKSDFPLRSKIRYLGVLGHRHIPYALYLVAASGKYYLRKALGKPRHNST